MFPRTWFCQHVQLHTAPQNSLQRFFSFKITAFKILVTYLWSIGFQGKYIQIKLLIVSLINIDLWNQRYVAILLVILYPTIQFRRWNTITALLQNSGLKDGLKTKWWTETSQISLAQRSQWITGRSPESKCTGLTYTPLHPQNHGPVS